LQNCKTSNNKRVAETWQKKQRIKENQRNTGKPQKIHGNEETSTNMGKGRTTNVEVNAKNLQNLKFGLRPHSIPAYLQTLEHHFGGFA